MRLLGDYSKISMLNGHFRRDENFLLEPWKLSEIMDGHDEMHIIHSCYAAGWEKYWCHLPGSEEHLLIH